MLRRESWIAAAGLALALSGGAAPVFAAEDCATCHDAARFEAPVRASAHAGLGCAQCHADLAGGPHGRLPAKAPSPRATALASCASCHEAAAAEQGRSAHAEAARRGSLRAPADCAACHGEPHAITGGPRPPVEGDGARLVAFRREIDLCARCHADEALAGAAGVNPFVVETFEASMHGSRARLGLPGVATCTDCHGRHEILSPGDPRAALHADRRAALCARCHDGAHAGFAASFEHRAATQAGFPAGYWLRKAYSWLIVLVCGGLALHTFLEVQAEVRERFLARRTRHA